MKSIFFQQELGERRVKWMNGLHEYDLKFKPVHTIKGHGLCQRAIEAVYTSKDDPSGSEQEINMYNMDRSPPTNIPTSWYADVK